MHNTFDANDQESPLEQPITIMSRAFHRMLFAYFLAAENFQDLI